ncbi:MAG: hypothetical protein UW45_C0035G0011 [Parcubacteria group bacterium GW2011_GWC2_44_22]|nr:MAG: hypothetical protein UW45_C0035G0011 [Parcubacteria group bacterium GW2011_GWC2_44_22]
MGYFGQTHVHQKPKNNWTEKHKNKGKNRKKKKMIAGGVYMYTW